MSKTKRNLLKLFTYMMVMCASVLVNAKEVSAATVEFIDVATYGSGKKGDSTLITFRNKYYLVDTGSVTNYKPNDSKTTPLESKLNTLKNNGKFLSGIIITHAHGDHMGALKNIIKKSGVVNSNTKIYINSTYVPTDLENALTTVKNNVTRVTRGTVYNVSTGKKVNLSDTKSSGLYLYGSTIYKSNVTDKRAQNNSSMIVQLKGGNVNALLLGDIVVNSLSDNELSLLKQYMAAIDYNNVTYDVCKVGHHGVRDAYSRKSYIDKNGITRFVYQDRIDKECTNVYDILTVKNYVFTTTKSNVLGEVRHNYLTQRLNPTKKFYYSSDASILTFK